MQSFKTITAAALLAMGAACASQPPATQEGQAAEATEATASQAETRSKPDCRYRASTRSRLGNRDCS